MDYKELIPNIEKAMSLLDDPEVTKELGNDISMYREDLSKLKDMISKKEYGKAIDMRGWDGPAPYHDTYKKAWDLFHITKELKKRIRDQYEKENHKNSNFWK